MPELRHAHAQVMYRDHSYHAIPTYASHLADLAASPHAIVAEDRVIQFPFVAGSGPNEKTEEDLKNQQRKREEATKRLKEQAARQRQEKVRPVPPPPPAHAVWSSLVCRTCTDSSTLSCLPRPHSRRQLERQQEELTAFTALNEARGTVSKPEYDQKLKAAGFSSVADLEDYLKKLEKSLTRARNRELGIDDSENKVRAGVFFSFRSSMPLRPRY